LAEATQRILIVGPAWVGDMVMAQSLFKTLKQHHPAVLIDVLAPAWSSDWLGERAREKLRDYGIAPPAAPVRSPRELWREAAPIGCPRCSSADTEELSRFGSTPCKALYRCRACLEPFEYFKCI